MIFITQYFTCFADKIFLLAFTSLISLFSCRPESPVIEAGFDWNIPRNQIIRGGVSKDGIPSLFNPRTIPADQADYLSDDDLVMGLVV